MCEVVSKKCFKNALFSKKNALFSNMCTFLSHCFKTKNYHCLHTNQMISKLQYLKEKSVGNKMSDQNTSSNSWASDKIEPQGRILVPRQGVESQTQGGDGDRQPVHNDCWRVNISCKRL